MGARERFDLSGKIALITGAARGIGRGLAIGLAEHGADIALIDRVPADQAAPVLAAIKNLGRQAWYFEQDLAKTEELAALSERVWKQCGRVDILINNAGIAFLERFDEISIETWRKTMAVNSEAMYFLTQPIARRMIAAKIKGRIINLSSKNGFVAEAGLAHYNASKGAVELMTQSLAIELGEHGITVNTLAPGIIETEIAGEFKIDPKFFEYYREHIPLEGRYGTVEDVVGAAVFMASRAGAYMTGQHIIVDGGVLCEQVPRLKFMPRK
jgi:NAD(P)-dependent dehydrogenase (short-subunit alcohol dehydrogenase family)